ncbi:RAMP superfamily CRISPR-associated protein [Fusobacterium animalis]|uniref:RAMP superfamily CRISPR-associated protein n=1 Tax=Fusobacterium animalis TaxID=76859 RepID=UPI0030CFF378
MKENKKIEEFLRLDNKITLKLRIVPLSPLCIKLSCDDEENDSNSLSAFQTTEGGIKIKNNNSQNNNKQKKATEIYKREGEIYISGSTLKGLFRDRFTTMYGSIDEKRNRLETDYINELFGHTENKKDEYETPKKSSFFIQDAFLEDEESEKAEDKINKLRQIFYSNEKNEVFEGKDKIIRIRSITPIDHFSLKAKVPLQYEYTMENFSTELIINNAKLKDLQGMFFIIRDSLNQEIRIGNSKTRGFGLIKFEIKDLIYEQFKSQEDELKILEKYFEERENENRLTKFNFSKKLYLKEEFKKLYEKDENPTDFIISLFKAKGGKK